MFVQLSQIGLGRVGVLLRDGLVLGHKHLHECPGDEVGHGAVAEDYHVAGGFACHTEELEGFALLLGMGEEETAAPVDGEGTETAEHGADAGDGGYGRLGEHVADGGVEVGRP